MHRNKQNVVVSNTVREPRLPCAKLTEFLYCLPWIIGLVSTHRVFKLIPKRLVSGGQAGQYELLKLARLFSILFFHPIRNIENAGSKPDHDCGNEHRLRANP